MLCSYNIKFDGVKAAKRNILKKLAMKLEQFLVSHNITNVDAHCQSCAVVKNLSMPPGHVTSRGMYSEGVTSH